VGQQRRRSGFLKDILEKDNPPMKYRTFRKGNVYLLQLCLMLCLSILITGCKGSSGDIHSVEQVVKSGDMLYQDDFSSVPSGWGTWDRDGAVVTYEQGGLRILVNQADYDFWSVAGKHFQDAVIEVDARRIAGPEDNDYGVICRYQDAKNFYMFLVSSDGYYGIGKVKNDQHSLIGIEQLQYTELIRPEQVDTRLRVDCVGDTLILYIDGEKLLEVRDSDFSSGDVGVLAGAYSTPGVDILFDNFEVRQP
jgi:hypothetical protein